MGCHLQTITLENTFPAAKPKFSFLPILVVLFVISYGLLTMLVVEQGRTIENQRSMIQVLMGDTMQLNVMKQKEIQRGRAAVPTQPHAPVHPKSQAPSTQTPSNQVKPQMSARNQADTKKIQKLFPQKPPKGVADAPDVRRDQFSI
jgi:hypothetical protein